MSDPLGYRLDLADAVAESPPNPRSVAMAYARCLLHGIRVGGDMAIRSLQLFPAAVETVTAEIRKWTESARTLGDRWVATDDPWEADELVWTMVHLRTEAESLWALLGDDTLRKAVDEFDDSLRAEESLLATLAGTPRLENYKSSLVDAPGRWWLDAKPDPIEMLDLPPPEYWRAVREIIVARHRPHSN